MFNHVGLIHSIMSLLFFNQQKKVELAERIGYAEND
jgi:hypothetical protein